MGNAENPNGDLDASDVQRLESLIEACDDVLEFHERAGSADGEAAKQVRAKRQEFQARLVPNRDGVADLRYADLPGRRTVPGASALTSVRLRRRDMGSFAFTLGLRAE